MRATRRHALVPRCRTARTFDREKVDLAKTDRSVRGAVRSTSRRRSQSRFDAEGVRLSTCAASARGGKSWCSAVEVRQLLAGGLDSDVYTVRWLPSRQRDIRRKTRRHFGRTVIGIVFEARRGEMGSGPREIDRQSGGQQTGHVISSCKRPPTQTVESGGCLAFARSHTTMDFRQEFE